MAQTGDIIILKYGQKEYQINDFSIDWKQLVELVNQQFNINESFLQLSILLEENSSIKIDRNNWNEYKNAFKNNGVMTVEVTRDWYKNHYYPNQQQEPQQEIPNQARFQVSAKIPSYQQQLQQQDFQNDQIQESSKENKQRLSWNQKDPSIQEKQFSKNQVQNLLQQGQQLLFQEQQKENQSSVENWNFPQQIESNEMYQAKQLHQENQNQQILEVINLIQQQINKNGQQNQNIMKEVEKIGKEQNEMLQKIEIMNQKIENMDQTQSQMINFLKSSQNKPEKQQEDQLLQLQKKVSQQKQIQYGVAIKSHIAPTKSWIADELLVKLIIVNVTQGVLPQTCEIVWFNDLQEQKSEKMKIGGLIPQQNQEVEIRFKMPPEQKTEETRVRLSCVIIDSTTQQKLSLVYNFFITVITPQVQLIDLQPSKENYEIGEHGFVRVFLKNSGHQSWPAQVILQDLINPQETYQFEINLQSNEVIQADLEFIAQEKSHNWQLFYNQEKFGPQIQFNPKILAKNIEIQEQEQVQPQQNEKITQNPEADKVDQVPQVQDAPEVPEEIIKRYKLNEQKVKEIQQILQIGISQDIEKIAFYVKNYEIDEAINFLMLQN